MKKYTSKEKADYFMKKQDLAIQNKQYKEAKSYGNSAAIFLKSESRRLKKESSLIEDLECDFENE